MKDSKIFVKAVRNYQESKFRKTGSRAVTAEEIKAIREELANQTDKAPRIKESKELREYREFKEAKTGSRLVTPREKNLVMAEAKKEAGLKLVRESRLACVAAKANVRRGNLVEAAELIKKAGKKLIEADQSFDGMPVADAGAAPADPNAMGADLNAATPVGQLPQNIIDSITTLKSTIDSLAQAAGIESPVEFGGDAAAGVPGVTGTNDTVDAAADPNAMGAAPAPMGESKIRARLEARKARLNETKEMAKAVACATSGYIACNDNLEGVPQAKMDTSVSTEQVKIPSTKELLGGTHKGPVAAAKTWPTKPISEPSQSKKVSVKESEEESWAERTLDEKLEQKKVNWNEILKSGLMG